MSKPIHQRVYERFAAKGMKPEKVRELMLKLRKGAGFGTMKALMPVFQHLGWSFDNVQFLKDTKGYDFGLKSKFFKDRADIIQEDWDKAKAEEVSQLPDPNGLPLHKKVYQQVTGLVLDEASNTGSFTAMEWQVSKAIKVTSPTGKTFVCGEHPDTFSNAYPSHLKDYSERGVEGKTNLEKWLKTEGGFIDQINAELGTDSVEVEKERAKQEKLDKALSADNAGTCPCCFGIFKLAPKCKEGKDRTLPGMVLHGYKRPGLGYIDGNCSGVDWPPFELSPEGTGVMVRIVRRALESAEANLTLWKDRIRSGASSVVEVNLGAEIVGNKLREKIFKKEDYSDREWDRLLDRHLKEVQDTRDRFKWEVDFLEKKVRSWELKPLRGKA